MNMSPMYREPVCRKARRISDATSYNCSKISPLPSTLSFACHSVDHSFAHSVTYRKNQFALSIELGFIGYKMWY
jgi:hypothetical protein